MNSKILIVDDEQEIVDSLKMFFELKGYEIYGACNSRDAISVIENQKPKVILLDISLKEKTSGLNLIPLARQCNPNVQIAVITGHDKSLIEKQCLDAGAQEVYGKGLDIDELEAIILNLLKKG